MLCEGKLNHSDVNKLVGHAVKMKRKYLSGSQKRKKKNDNFDKAVQSTTFIKNYYTTDKQVLVIIKSSNQVHR